MVDILGNLSGIGESYGNLFFDLPPEISLILQLILFALLIALLSFFIWIFYKTISKKDILPLNLNQYNWSEHPVLRKFEAVVFYLIEYIIVAPVLILVWFAALSIFVLVLIETRTTWEILLISAALVSSIRILAYYHREIAQDLAKLFPFITLSLFALSPDFFNLDRISAQILEIPHLIGNIFYFLVAVVLVEIVLRLVHTVKELFKSEIKRAEDI